MSGFSPRGYLQGFTELLQIRAGLLRGRDSGRRDIRFDDRLNHVLGKIDENRPWSSRTGNLKGLPDRILQISDLPDQKVVFCAGPGDAGDVHLLKPSLMIAVGTRPVRTTTE
jgi:hypothetical protein